MKIAQLAPLWETVPPKAYGGIELVVYSLCEDLFKKGHDVTLYACGQSTTSAKIKCLIDGPMRELNVGSPIYHELQAIEKMIEESGEYDIIHNHLGFQALPFAKYMKAPMITTLHGAFCSKEDIDFYKKYKDLNYISISDSQRVPAPFLNYISTVYNGIDIERYPYQQNPNTVEPYLAFLGRISEEKGTHLAIQLAKETNHKLIIAGKINKSDEEYHEEYVKPYIDNKQIVYIGELSHKPKVELLKNALATIHPVTWPEPFGLVMAESMLCGTPVLALNKGSIPEVIEDTVTGFVENSIEELIKRVKEIKHLNRADCRERIERLFSTQKMTDNYLKAYQKILSSNTKTWISTNTLQKQEL